MARAWRVQRLRLGGELFQLGALAGGVVLQGGQRLGLARIIHLIQADRGGQRPRQQAVIGAAAQADGVAGLDIFCRASASATSTASTSLRATNPAEKLPDIALMGGKRFHQLIGHFQRLASAQHIQIRLGHRQLEVLPGAAFAGLAASTPASAARMPAVILPLVNTGRLTVALALQPLSSATGCATEPGRRASAIGGSRPARPLVRPGEVGLHLGHGLVARPHRAGRQRGPAVGLGAVHQMAAGLRVISLVCSAGLAASAAAQAASSDSASAGGASRVRARKRGACFMLTLQKFEVARHECAQAYV